MRGAKLRSAIALSGVLGMLACAPAALGDNFTVGTTTDAHQQHGTTSDCTTALAGNPCSLRSAVEAAAFEGGSSTITLPAGTYDLSLGDLDLANGDITIAGAGAGTTTIDLAPGAGGRIFQVDFGAVAEIDGVTITGGNTLGVPYDEGLCDEMAPALEPGGAILDNGQLSLGDDIITRNTSGGGGGAIEDSSTALLTITGSQVTDNVACPVVDGGGSDPANGGGIEEDGGGSVSITNSTLSGNAAPGIENTVGDGGALAELGGGGAMISVTGSTISGNTASDAGGGIAAEGADSTHSTAEVALNGDTFSGNTAEGRVGEDGGGAMFVVGDPTSVENTTITGNLAANGAGGGIQLDDSPLGLTTDASALIAFSTITGNNAEDGGGNLAAFAFTPLAPRAAQPAAETAAASDAAGRQRANADIAPDGSLYGYHYDDSIIAGSSADSNCEAEGNTDDLYTSGGNNIFDDTSCTALQSAAGVADQTLAPGTEVVQPLAGNGGSTQTEALLASSPAVDAADTTKCAAETGTPPADQRGVTRPQGSACDIGAFELAQAAPTSPDLTLSAEPASPSITVGDTDTVTDTITNVGTGDATGATFTDPGPGGYEITGATPGQGTCTTTASSVHCDLGTIATGASTTVVVAVTGTAAGPVTLNSAVTEDQTDPTPANNLAVATITVNAPTTTTTTTTPTTTTTTTTPTTPTTTTPTTTTPTPTTPTPTPPPSIGPKHLSSADLSVKKSRSVAHTTVGATVAYTLSVRNHGPGTAHGVVVTDTLPSGLTLVSGSVTGAHCTGTRVLRCALGTIAVGKDRTIRYRARVTHDGTLINRAAVKARTRDPKPGNNHAQATVKATAPAPTGCTRNEVFTDGYDPGARVNLVMVYIDGTLTDTLAQGDLRRVVVSPPAGTRSFTVKVVFYGTDQSTDTVVRAVHGCVPGPSHTSHTPPVPPGSRS